jgi:hypothetical protein
MSVRWCICWAAIACIIVSAGAPADDPPKPAPGGRYVFYSAKTAEDADVKAVTEALQKMGTKVTPMFKDQGCSWAHPLAGGDVKVIVSPKVVWLLLAVENLTKSGPVLEAVLQDVAQSRGIKLAGRGRFSLQIRVPIRAGGKVKLAAAALPRRRTKEYFSCTTEEEFRKKHGLDKDADVRLKPSGGTVFWIHERHGKEAVKEQAIVLVKQPEKEQKKKND